MNPRWVWIVNKYKVLIENIYSNCTMNMLLMKVKLTYSLSTEKKFVKDINLNQQRVDLVKTMNLQFVSVLREPKSIEFCWLWGIAKACFILHSDLICLKLLERFVFVWLFGIGIGKMRDMIGHNYPRSAPPRWDVGVDRGQLPSRQLQ